MEGKMRRIILLTSAFLLLFGSLASADLITQNNHIFINVANDAGVKYNMDYDYYQSQYGSAPGAATDTYFIKAEGGGQNELKISSTTTGGNVIAATSSVSNPSGSFYVTNSGGRGFDNDIILLASVKGPISNDFSLTVNSSGYTWTPAAAGAYNPAAPTDATYVAGISETFYKSDFLYGPQTNRPGPSGFSNLFTGQTASDSAEYLMFIDLYVGNIKSTTIPGLVNDGAVKVDFSFTGLYDTKVALNAYGWCTASNQGEGINWTNSTAGGSSDSGYSLNAMAAAPVPIPPSVLLLGSGFSGMFFFRRRKIQA
jgi:hypothetical protein